MKLYHNQFTTLRWNNNMRPHRRHPLCTLSSSFLVRYGCRASSLVLSSNGHPVIINCRTLLSKGSLLVQVLISVAVTGVVFKCWSTKLISPGTGTGCGCCDSGSLLRTSALANCLPGLCFYVVLISL